MSKIRIGIVGYGNLGRGVESAIKSTQDMELVGVFTRRNPSSLTIATEGVGVYTLDDAKNMTDKIDVMILCGGSATDLPEQSPEFAQYFNIIDSFDTHAKIPEHFANVDEQAKKNNKVAVISAGWDPGMFSINRTYSESIMPIGKTYTFWGKGVSQGHSDAIRRIAGVKNAKQYTVPVEKVLDEVRNGSNKEYSTREKHLRECFVVAENGADLAKIENEIVTMPNYFSDYDTTVNFISEDEFNANHSGMAHGGFVISSETDAGVTNVIEYSLKLDSNPVFTAKVLVAYARAAQKLSAEGFKGAKTVLDIAPSYLSPKSPEQLRKEIL